ncbi:unnamed protein product [Linum trigynum]|uniref:Uncharacterized protein n=1 Tax=Linum trigynum TaxID=586398 RepID=A0AAV2CV51_9ROSI
MSSTMSDCRSRRDENPMKLVSRRSTLWTRGSPVLGGGGCCAGRGSAGRQRRPGARAGGCYDAGGTSGPGLNPSMYRIGPKMRNKRMECKVPSSNLWVPPSFEHPERLTSKYLARRVMYRPMDVT